MIIGGPEVQGREGPDLARFRVEIDRIRAEMRMQRIIITKDPVAQWMRPHV
ncbi:hypothetical protein [Tistrella mobilis]|uniref:Uncharacterized protein n=1 Tax=Tistrella mobilis (strain KA081020-065) TaxID=1110502 RepID=I3TQT2_TISMK|nr:hypothetical protein [Tistrella mobilis]AFK55120.1 hypothetical protein TMO_3282 [Tistrella mobilis KA081020-065]